MDGGDAHPTGAVDVGLGVVDEQHVRRRRAQYRQRGGVGTRGRFGARVVALNRGIAIRACTAGSTRGRVSRSSASLLVSSARVTPGATLSMTASTWSSGVNA